tara:strand:+ start:2620 stop:4698 length:2079 start_codon:yes stop_codon:yes gene_type:complete
MLRTGSLLLFVFFSVAVADAASVDIAKYNRDSGISVAVEGEKIQLKWFAEPHAPAGLTLNTADDNPLISEIRTDRGILQDVDPVFLVTVGSRDMDPRRGWIRFFDKVHKRPYKQHRAKLDIKSARVYSEGRSTSVTVEGLSAGEFSGSVRFTVYAGCRLVHVEALLSTEEDRRAIVYDAGIVSSGPGWSSTAGIDSTDRWRRLDPRMKASPLSVRHRMVMAENSKGAVAVFAAPHQYFYPLDFADNFGFTWQGTGYRGMVRESGLGIRQPLDGDQRFVPWFNAPPKTEQRLGFFLLAGNSSEETMKEVKRFTRGDRFKPLPGFKTFTSHYHVEHSLDVIQSKVSKPAEDRRLGNPGFKQVFKRMGVDVVHLAEFHKGKTPRLKTDERLRQLKVMHDECKRLSEPGFLLLPGEEPNVHLGGHWISFFPKPVYWVLNRKGQPFVQEKPGFGKVYHVGSSADVLKLFQIENGLNWTAHARIKSSTGYPDRYRQKDYYKSDRFLGAAWKSMPADLSRERLGERVLDLEDDMANWGTPKYILGEVDVFKIRQDYELWGHMNINYLKLDRVPRYEEGWKPVLDALRNGEFFVSTGEMLLPEFRINGGRSGQTLAADDLSSAQLDATLEWTFPPAFIAIVSGDGEQVYQKRVSLKNREAFGTETLRLRINLKGRKWARLEVWDVAGNGAFTQPIWIGNK